MCNILICIYNQLAINKNKINNKKYLPGDYREIGCIVRGISIVPL